MLRLLQRFMESVFDSSQEILFCMPSIELIRCLDRCLDDRVGFSTISSRAFAGSASCALRLCGCLGGSQYSGWSSVGKEGPVIASREIVLGRRIWTTLEIDARWVEFHLRGIRVPEIALDE